MKVELEKSHALAVPADIAWRVLQNIESVASCMPGATITERVDDANYKGTVTVRVGPATVSFKGDIEVKDIDSTKRELRLVGKGSDTSGQSGASMDLLAWVQEGDATHCQLVGRSEVTVTGKVANFGGRMMGTVSDQILKQFFDNFSALVAASAAQQGGVAAAEETVVRPAHELNALSLFWAIVKDFFRKLFSPNKAG